MKRKLLSFITAFVMVLGLAVILPERNGFVETVTVSADASSHTADDAINWCASKVGQTVGNGQCVGLINMYMSYLGVDYTQYLVVGAKDFAQPRFCPTGWQRLAGVEPQKGDVMWYGQAVNGVMWRYVNPQLPFIIRIMTTNSMCRE